MTVRACAAVLLCAVLAGCAAKPAAEATAPAEQVAKAPAQECPCAEPSAGLFRWLTYSHTNPRCTCR
jgi:hypothetical protein